MTEPVPEFSRPLQVDRVPRGGSFEKLAADARECRALAGRLNVPALHALKATLKATPWRGGGLKLEGELTADIDQVSVVSLEAFRATVTFPVQRYYLPEGAVSDAEEEEVDPIVAGQVDMGECIAETLALELDPYPRKPGEHFDEPVESDVPAKPDSPFAVLEKLKKDKG